MNYLLSYGAGINSTALILLMEESCEFMEIFPQLHILFADTGAEHPDTYQFLSTMENYLADRGQQIIRVKADKPLLEMSRERNFLPSRMSRWCTVESKLNPLWDYETKVFSLDFRDDSIQLIRFIGIDAGETHRVRTSGKKHIRQRYPLIEYNLDRAACIRLIEKRGLPIPRKSGCYFCPFASRYELARLSYEYPELFNQAVQLEEQVNAAWKKRDRASFYLIQGLPLSELFEKREAIIERFLAKQRKKRLQPGLFDSLEEQELEEKLDALPCLCGR